MNHDPLFLPGTKLAYSSYYDNGAGDQYKPVEVKYEHSGTTDIRDMCYLVHEFDSVARTKLINIRGDASIAAIRIEDSTGTTQCPRTKY